MAGSKPFPRRLQITNNGKGFDISEAAAGNKRFQARPGNNNGAHVLTFQVDPGNNIQVKSSPKTLEIEIRQLGNNKGASLTDTDVVFLKDVMEELLQDETKDTDTIDSLPAQAMRSAQLLKEWPRGKPFDFTFDATKEEEHQKIRSEMAAKHPVPDDAPKVPGPAGRRTMASSSGGIDVSYEHGGRRLFYQDICPFMNDYVWSTHNDNYHNRGDDATSFFAFLSPVDGGLHRILEGRCWLELLRPQPRP